MRPQDVIASVPAVDGAGVRINRVAGPGLHSLLDPFLMVDEIRSREAQDYMAGFPSHPHRGFETISYLLKGRMRHEDHLGNQKVMSDGGVQWMTTGRGIVHSEMPEPSAGQFHGFQIWLNLPRELKMMAPAYHDLEADEILDVQRSGSRVRLIAGALAIEDELIRGGFSPDRRTQATIADVAVPVGSKLSLSVAEDMKLLIYVYRGKDPHVPEGHLGVYQNGRALLQADEPLHALVLAGAPLHEPIVQHGPFVMNTAGEIEQAVRDFASGRFTS